MNMNPLHNVFPTTIVPGTTTTGQPSHEELWREIARLQARVAQLEARPYQQYQTPPMLPTQPWTNTPFYYSGGAGGAGMSF